MTSKKSYLVFLSFLFFGTSCGNSLLVEKPTEKNLFSSVDSLTEISRHAIDPLSEDELREAVMILKSANLLGQGWYVQQLSTAEPEKNPEMLYPAYNVNLRKAYAVILNLKLNERYECILDLTTHKLLSKKLIKGQPAVLEVEYALVDDAIRKNSFWLKAMSDRGILNPKDVFIDTWGPGDISGLGLDESHRFLRASFYLQEGSSNPYARPIEGITAIYDSTLGDVIRISDTGIKPIQDTKRDFLDKAQLESPKPLNCSPENASFKVSKAHQVSWKNWRFRFQMHPREGLVLYDVGQTEQGLFRSILERASLSEMVVPYSDPDKNWYWRAAFDEGDYGIGINANRLLRGVHYPVEGQTFDAIFADNNGKIIKKPSVVAVYERNAGMLWSHWNSGENLMTARSAKELVIFFLFTVGNYDYGVHWIFKENGSIQMQAVLTGMLLTKGHNLKKCGRCSSFSRADQYGMLVDTNLIATAHQHFFNFRLDFSIDGPRNSIAEISLQEAPDTLENPYGNAFLIAENVLETEKEGMRNSNAHQAVHWWVFNRDQRNRLGHFSGYALEPGESGGYFGKAHSHLTKTAPFLANSLHVTQYDPEEMHAAGNFPSQNQGDGLPIWIKSRDKSIQQEDLVVWYTLGVTHLPVAEDWPIMPVHKAGFNLKPMGFFEQAAL